MRVVIERPPKPGKPPTNDFYQVPYIYSNWLTLPRRLILVPMSKVIGKVRHYLSPKSLIILGLIYLTDHVGMLSWLPLSQVRSEFLRLTWQYGRYLLIAQLLLKAIRAITTWHQPRLRHLYVRLRRK